MNKKEIIGASTLGCVFALSLGMTFIHPRTQKLDSRADIENLSSRVSILDYSSLSNGIPIQLDLIDSDKNGSVDALCWRGNAYWHTEDWKGSVSDRSRLMSAEVRTSLSDYLKNARQIELRLFDETKKVIDSPKYKK